MHKVYRFRKYSPIASLLLAALMICIIALPVFAISNPTSMAINSVAIFTNVTQTGDQYWIVRYQIYYTSNPADTPASSFMTSIFNNTTALYTPYSVATLYYGESFTTVYLNATQALTWNGNYYVRLLGQPSKFPSPVEGSNMTTQVLTTTNWKTSSTNLTDYLLQEFHALDLALYGVNATLLNASGTKLTQSGGTYILTVMPGLNNLLPNIFSETSYFPNWATTNYTHIGSTNFTAHAGTILRGALEDIGQLAGTNITGGTTQGGVWIGLIVSAMLCMSLGGLGFAIGRSPIWGIMGAILGLPFVYWMGILDIQIAVLIAVLLGILFGVLWALGRM